MLRNLAVSAAWRVIRRLDPMGYACARFSMIHSLEDCEDPYDPLGDNSDFKDYLGAPQERMFPPAKITQSEN